MLVALPLGLGLYYVKKYYRQLRIPAIVILPTFLVTAFLIFYSAYGLASVNLF